MKLHILLLVPALIAVTFLCAAAGEGDGGGGDMTAKEGKRIELPVVTGYGGFPLDQALGTRRSVREYTDDKLDIVVISKLLWSAQGMTEKKYGLRTAPSAGATYPLEVYVATEEYVARYDPSKHDLTVTLKGDVRTALAKAALDQPWVEKAPAVFVFAAVVSRTAGRYGGRAERYVKIEVGLASENLMLQAVALGLGSVAVGAYDDDDVKDVLQLPDEQDVYLLVPVGRPAE